jgi:hypothetical protein
MGGAFRAFFGFQRSSRSETSSRSAKVKAENAGDARSTVVSGVNHSRGPSMPRSVPPLRRSLIDNRPRGSRAAAPVGLLAWAMSR